MGDHDTRRVDPKQQDREAGGRRQGQGEQADLEVRGLNGTPVEAML